ncbi:DUF1638 domain-containing protein [Thermodesulfobacteriota bacterium]
MSQKAVKIIACASVIEEMLPFLPADIDYKEVESGLHTNSEKLRNAIQTIIDDSSEEFENIVLGFGLCSMAAVGLKASHSRLIIPRVDDCIGLFLGSQESYKKQVEKEHGTYFLSKGWIDAGVTLVEEFKQFEERMGKEAADIVRERMLKGYTRLAFIDMGHKNQGRYRAFSKKAADELGLRFDEIKGTARLIKKMIFGPWDEKNFIIVPPGKRISFGDFKADQKASLQQNDCDG